MSPDLSTTSNLMFVLPPRCPTIYITLESGQDAAAQNTTEHNQTALWTYGCMSALSPSQERDINVRHDSRRGKGSRTTDWDRGLDGEGPLLLTVPVSIVMYKSLHELTILLMMLIASRSLSNRMKLPSYTFDESGQISGPSSIATVYMSFLLPFTTHFFSPSMLSSSLSDVVFSSILPHLHCTVMTLAP